MTTNKEPDVRLQYEQDGVEVKCHDWGTWHTGTVSFEGRDGTTYFTDDDNSPSHSSTYLHDITEVSIEACATAVGVRIVLRKATGVTYTTVAFDLTLEAMQAALLTAFSNETQKPSMVADACQ
jgi:hypothetical protein